MEINTLLNIASLVVMIIMATVGTAVGFFLKRHFADYDDHKKTITLRIDEVEHNYITRFENISKELVGTREHLTKSINDSEKNLTKLITDNLNHKEN